MLCPLPNPVVTDTIAERKELQAQLAYRTSLELLEDASDGLRAI